MDNAGRKTRIREKFEDFDFIRLGETCANQEQEATCTARIQEPQNEVNCMNDSRDF